jgi:proline racemase
MEERRQYLATHLDHLRTALILEPRGHSALSGAILQPPITEGTEFGVLFIEVTGCLPMCGHATIGVATVLVETGMVEVIAPVTTLRLDVPAGVVTVEVEIREGRATRATFRNVPSFMLAPAQEIEVDGVGRLNVDIAFGGNFYAILPASAVDLRADSAHARELIDVGMKIMKAVNEQCEPVHPLIPTVRGCRHVNLLAEGADARRSPHAMVIHPGWLDRSPCGTGTSARIAQLHAAGEISVGDPLVSVSVIGSEFTGRIVDTTTVGAFDAVIPSISGRAWITGTASWMIDPDDPFADGFSL